ncbi:15323_t:CDS:2 [Cetraspora pellucida]|uniref:15323_t:CDS:1 n=1 Tax=Cetraspora pellucida TaxID=1433469 RepID=A0A9N8YWK9_9GLOM|nr:15323_t:CDS:2 [Cetraspora pellucida]
MKNSNDISEQMDLQTEDTLISDITNNVFLELSENKLNNAPNSDVSFENKEIKFLKQMYKKQIRNEIELLLSIIIIGLEGVIVIILRGIIIIVLESVIIIGLEGIIVIVLGSVIIIFLEDVIIIGLGDIAITDPESLIFFVLDNSIISTHFSFLNKKRLY